MVQSTRSRRSLPDALASLRTGIATRLAVLANVQFRRLLVGRVVSVVGDNLYTIAAMWLVYDLTGSTAFTGLAGFLGQAPGALQFLVGPVVDRSRLDRVLAYSELVQAPLVLLVPIAWITGHLSVWVVLAVMPLLGIADLFAMPAQNATIPRIVEDERLVRANSLGAAIKQVAIAGSRAVAGAIVALVGPVAVYVVDAVTFGVAAVAFGRLSVPARDGADGARDLDLTAYRDELRDGIGVLTGSIVGWMLVGSLFANFLVGVAAAVLPAFAADLGGPTTYGLIMAGMMAGRVVGSITASAVDEWPLGRVTVVGFLLSGACWVAAVYAPWQALAVVLFACSRVPASTYSISVLATLQTGIPDELLGRVSSVVSSATAVVAPAGMLVGGVLGGYLDVRTVLVAGGIGSVAVAAVWLAIPRLRRFGPPTEVTRGQFV